MAYDKIIPIRSRLDHCVGYVLNPEKTGLSSVLDYIGSGEKNALGQTVLETAVNCRLETACQDMMDTKRRWGKTGGVLGYHLIHSYAPGEVTPVQAHELGVVFARGSCWETAMRRSSPPTWTGNISTATSCSTLSPCWTGKSTGTTLPPTTATSEAFPMPSAPGMACLSSSRRTEAGTTQNGGRRRPAKPPCGT